MRTRENTQGAVRLEKSAWGEYCLVPSEGQKIQFAKTGRIVFAERASESSSVPDIDISPLSNLIFKGESVKPPEFAWLRTNHRTRVEVFITSREKGIIPSRMVNGKKPGSLVPEKQVVSLRGQSGIRTEITSVGIGFDAKLVALPNLDTNH